MLILGDKIAKIEEAGGMPEIPFLLPEDVIDGSDRILTPGFIDCHVHVLGGGGEGGFANRTPEATVEGMTRFGVTTVVGCRWDRWDRPGYVCTGGKNKRIK